MKRLVYIAPIALLAIFILPLHAHAQAAAIASAFGGAALDIVGGILSPLVVVLLKLTSYISMLGGVALNAIVYTSVTQMANNLSATGIGATIDTTWGVIRDLANMGFIFVLLYTAIMTIFGEGNYRETIVRTVMAAILINFSLFFTKVIIDAANVLALTFYHAIAPGAAENFLSAGLSNAFMQPMGISTLWAASGGWSNLSNFAVMGILGSVVLLISAFIFFAIAVMFVIRYVVLILVLILSPIAFVANVLPGLKKQSGQWWDALLGQAFFAPIYFLLTWVALTVINGITANTVPNWSGALSGVAGASASATTYEPSLIMTVINFGIIIGFLVASLIISKSWAEKAGSGVKKLTSTALGFAGGASIGVAGRFGRGTLGRFGQVVADSEKLKAAAPTSRLARLTLAAGAKTSGANFDLRSTAVGGQLDAGKAQKGGFAADMKDKIKAQEKVADRFKPSELTISSAEKELDEAKKTTDTTRIANAQKKVDELKGANEADLRKRRVNEIRVRDRVDEKEAKRRMAKEENDRFQRVRTLMQQHSINEKAAKEMAKNEDAPVGWSPEEVKSASTKRTEEYAKGVESQSINIPEAVPIIGGRSIPYDLTGRHLFGFGSVKKEYQAAAVALRKKVKEKKPADKIAEEAAKVAKETTEEESGGGAPSAPSGGTPPSSSPSGGSSGGPATP